MQIETATEKTKRPRSRKFVSASDVRIDSSFVLSKLIEMGIKEMHAPEKGSKVSPKGKTAYTKEETKALESRPHKWNKLLCACPKETDLGIAWAQKMLAVSDIENADIEYLLAKDAMKLNIAGLCQKRATKDSETNSKQGSGGKKV